ncbi:MAG: FkbM family methyltransferase [Bacteroidota bacterium]
MMLSFLRHINRFGLAAGMNLYIQRQKKTGECLLRLPGVLHPINLRCNTTDIPTFDQVFWHREYEFNLGFEPKVIIDCGANIGLASVFFKNKYPKAKIIAVEPEGSNANLLNRNTKPYNDIQCITAGIWNKPAHLSVSDEQGLGHWGYTVKEVPEGTPAAIKAVTIDTIMREFNLTEIDLLKIDIEGSEKELFDSNYESWLPKTKVIMIELHDRMRKGCSKALFTAVMKYDFSVRSFGENIICMKYDVLTALSGR